MLRTRSLMKVSIVLLSFILLAGASPFPQQGIVTVTATTTVAEATVTASVTKPIQASTPAPPETAISAPPAPPATVVTHITTWFTDPLYSGSWETIASSEGTCISFDATMNNHVSSYKLTNLGGPAGTESYCYLYDTPNCPHIDPTYLNVIPFGWTYVGKDNDRMLAPFNDAVSSYRCLTKKFDKDHVKPDSWILEFWFEDTF